MSDSLKTQNVGKISQIIGPVLDIAFGQGQGAARLTETSSMTLGGGGLSNYYL